MYKLCLFYKNKLQSLDIYNKHSIEYTPGEWTYPKFGHIFVFQTLQDLLNFCGVKDPIDSEYQVWFCAVDIIYSLENVAIHPEHIYDFWNKKISEYLMMKSPVGTIGTNKCKLLKRVIGMKNGQPIFLS